MIAKKKQILTATLMIALVAAVAVNWYYTRPTSVSENESAVQEETRAENLGDTILVAGTVSNTEEVNDKESNEEEAQSAAAQADLESAEAYFSEAKLKRTNMHDTIVNEIETVLSSDSVSQEEKSRVTDMLLDFKNSIKSETDTENLIKAKVGGECLVVINDSSAQVILQKGLLNDTVLLQITEIIEKNTNISAENLTIIETK